jgi:hypothetical protein
MWVSTTAEEAVTWYEKVIDAARESDDAELKKLGDQTAQLLKLPRPSIESADAR